MNNSTSLSQYPTEHSIPSARIKFSVISYIICAFTTITGRWLGPLCAGLQCLCFSVLAVGFCKSCKKAFGEGCTSPQWGKERSCHVQSERRTETPLSCTVLYINERQREHHVCSHLSSLAQKHDNCYCAAVFFLYKTRTKNAKEVSLLIFILEMTSTTISKSDWSINLVSCLDMLLSGARETPLSPYHHVK